MQRARTMPPLVACADSIAGRYPVGAGSPRSQSVFGLADASSQGSVRSVCSEAYRRQAPVSHSGGGDMHPRLGGSQGVQFASRYPDAGASPTITARTILPQGA